MIIKNIFKIHILYYVVGFICFLTGNFKLFIMFSSIIIVHELGHLTGALIYKWNIDKVILLPFGGITIFRESLNKSLKEEFIITVLGPLFQIVFYLLIGNKNPIFNNLNLAILLFNLLPIVPLDGSKLINIISNKMTNFINSNYITNFVSIILLIGLTIFSLKGNLIFIVILLFLLVEIIKQCCNQKYYFNKFLLERHLNNYNFKKEKIINSVNKMCKEKRHLFYYQNKYVTEKEYIRKMFDKKA